jgi:hypothetical protein
MSHPNAFLAPRGRLELARCVVEDGWPLRRAAERFQVSVSTAARWTRRYRERGENSEWRTTPAVRAGHRDGPRRGGNAGSLPSE